MAVTAYIRVFPCEINLSVSGRTLLLLALGLPVFVISGVFVLVVKDLYPVIRPVVAAYVDEHRRFVQERVPAKGWCLNNKQVWLWAAQDECVSRDF